MRRSSDEIAKNPIRMYHYYDDMIEQAYREWAEEYGIDFERLKEYGEPISSGLILHELGSGAEETFKEWFEHTDIKYLEDKRHVAKVYCLKLIKEACC